MAASADSIPSIFQEVLRKLDKFLDDLNGNSIVPENTAFDLKIFWEHLNAAVVVLSHEASKVCLAFSKLPLPSIDEIHAFVNGILNAVETVVSIYFTLPISTGVTLSKNLKGYVKGLVSGIKELCVNARNPSARQLQSVGEVWEKCQSLENLPKDNKESVLLILKDELPLVEDAIGELEDAIQQYTENEESPRTDAMFGHNGMRFQNNSHWTAADLRVVHPCLGLMKAHKACLKKITKAISERGSIEDPSFVCDFDNIANIVSNSSSSIDSLVLSLYPPSSLNLIQDNVRSVRDLSKQLLETVESSHFYSEADKTWVEFLQRAVEHNYSRATTELSV